MKKNKFENFQSVLSKLVEIDARYRKNKDDDVFSDSLIKRFELTYDLAWKSLREFLIEQGITVEPSPRKVFAQAYQSGYLDSDDIWLEIISARNSSTHIYSEDIATQIATAIGEKYIQQFQFLEKLYREFNM